MSPKKFTCAAVVLVASALMAGPAAPAPRPAPPGNVWDIEIGKPISAFPNGFAQFACGTNGGPPAQPLESIADYMTCRPEANGWREVYFRYDDELEYWARAYNRNVAIAASGTKVFGLPVTTSVLVGTEGIVRGLRLVSDPRDASVKRSDARYLQNFLISRFRTSETNWRCVDLPLDERETTVNGVSVKQNCTLSADGIDYVMRARYLRGAGENQIDQHTGQFTEGQFESHVFFEMHES